MIPALPPLLLWATGLLLVFHSMLLSRMRMVPGGLIDTRFLNYCLEHTYRWLLRIHPHEGLWTYPIFYPHTNSAAYSDILLGVAPFYWIWRALGCQPDTAYQLWMMTIWTINFVAGYLFLRRCFDIAGAPSALGAFLFAFGNPRTANVVHEQLVSHFYALLAFAAVCQVFRLIAANQETRPHAGRWICLFFFALVAQAYAAYYPAFFLMLILFVAGAWSLAFAHYRRLLWAAVRRHYALIGTAFVASALMLWPMASHYMQAYREVGPRSFAKISTMVPPLHAWILVGRANWIYGKLSDATSVQLYSTSSQSSNGVGFLTIALSLAGLIAERKRRSVRLLLVVSISLVLVTSKYAGGATPWTYVYGLMPGADALRAVGRIGMFSLVPFSIGIAFLAQRLLDRRRYWLLGLATLICVVEQASVIRSYDKLEMRERISRISALLPASCNAFYLTGAGSEIGRSGHVEAMWVELVTGKPTVNGHSGNYPPGWDLKDIQMRNDRDNARSQKALDRWLRAHGLRPADVCRVVLPAGGGPPP